MGYVVVAAAEETRDRWERRLRGHGYDVHRAYDPPTDILVTIGGDGTILYAGRTYSDPTILPVRTAGSEGHRTTVDDDSLLAALDRVDRGDDAVTVERHRRLAAFRNGTELRGDFSALNEINLHHRSPVHAAVFATRVRGGVRPRDFDRVSGDGVLVATPFGSTGYFHSITGDTFSSGLGVAFNNVHRPADTPESLVLPPESVVEVELLEAEHGSGAILSRDDDHDTYDMPVGDPIEIRLTDSVVELLRLA